MENTKKAVELAEKELLKEKEREQIETIKKVIKATFEKIETKEGERKKLDKEIRTLKQDIDNIRAGRLDLIAERQEKDEDAKRTSIIIIEKVKEEHHHYHYHYDRWYEPWKITLKYPEYSGIIWNSNNLSGNSVYGYDDRIYNTTITNSVAKMASLGSYVLNSGTVKSIN